MDGRVVEEVVVMGFTVESIVFKEGLRVKKETAKYDKNVENMFIAF